MTGRIALAEAAAWTQAIRDCVRAIFFEPAFRAQCSAAAFVHHDRNKMAALMGEAASGEGYFTDYEAAYHWLAAVQCGVPAGDRWDSSCTS
jgi:hypothetical protein